MTKAQIKINRQILNNMKGVFDDVFMSKIFMEILDTGLSYANDVNNPVIFFIYMVKGTKNSLCIEYNEGNYNENGWLLSDVERFVNEIGIHDGNDRGTSANGLGGKSALQALMDNDPETYYKLICKFGDETITHQIYSDYAYEKVDTIQDPSYNKGFTRFVIPLSDKRLDEYNNDKNTIISDLMRYTNNKYCEFIIENKSYVPEPNIPTLDSIGGPERYLKMKVNFDRMNRKGSRSNDCRILNVEIINNVGIPNIDNLKKRFTENYICLNGKQDIPKNTCSSSKKDRKELPEILITFYNTYYDQSENTIQRGNGWVKKPTYYKGYGDNTGTGVYLHYKDLQISTTKASKFIRILGNAWNGNNDESHQYPIIVINQVNHKLSDEESLIRSSYGIKYKSYLNKDSQYKGFNDVIKRLFSEYMIFVPPTVHLDTVESTNVQPTVHLDNVVESTNVQPDNNRARRGGRQHFTDRIKKEAIENQPICPVLGTPTGWTYKGASMVDIDHRDNDNTNNSIENCNPISIPLHRLKTSNLVVYNEMIQDNVKAREFAVDQLLTLVKGVTSIHTIPDNVSKELVRHILLNQ